MNRNHRRPTCPTSGSDRGATVTTPSASTLIQLLGPGVSHGNIVLSRDESASLARMYGYVDEKPRSRPPRPEAPVRDAFTSSLAYEDATRAYKEDLRQWEAWRDPRAFMQAGAARNMLRYAEADGLRIMAWLARHVQPGEDPLRCVIQAAVAVGWDVDPSDIAWADADEDEQDGDTFEAPSAADGATEGR